MNIRSCLPQFVGRVTGSTAHSLTEKTRLSCARSLQQLDRAESLLCLRSETASSQLQQPCTRQQGFPSVSDLPHHWSSRRQARTGGPLLSRGFAGEPAASSSTEQLENSEEEAQPSPSDQEHEAPGGNELDSPSSYPKPALTTPGPPRNQWGPEGRLPQPNNAAELQAQMRMFMASFKEANPGKAQSVFDSYMGMCARSRNQNEGRLKPSLVPTLHSFNLYMRSLLAERANVGKMRKTMAFVTQVCRLQPNAGLYTLLLIRLSLEGTKGAGLAAVAVLNEAKEHGVELHLPHYANAILCTSNGQMHTVTKGLYLEAKEGGMLMRGDDKVKATMYSAILHMYARIQDFDTLQMLVADIREYSVHVKMNTLVMCILYSVIGLQNNIIYDVLVNVRGQHVPLMGGSQDNRISEGCLEQVLGICPRHADVRLAEFAWQMLNEMFAETSAAADMRHERAVGRARVAGLDVWEHRSVPELQIPSVPAYHAMVHTYAAAGDLRAAFRTVSQLQRVHADAPEALWYHEGLSPVVDACARSTSRLDEAFFLLEDMHLQGELVSTPMLNCIVAACGQIGDMGRAFETFETYGSFGQQPDTSSYNAVLQGCVAHNFLESVPKVLEEMEQEKVPYDEKTHTIIVDSMIVKRHAKEAIAYALQLKQDKIRIPVALADRLLQRCRTLNYGEGIRDLVRGPNPIINRHITHGQQPGQRMQTGSKVPTQVRVKPQGYFQKGYLPPRSQFSEHPRGTASLSLHNESLPDQQHGGHEPALQDDSQSLQTGRGDGPALQENPQEQQQQQAGQGSVTAA